MNTDRMYNILRKILWWIALLAVAVVCLLNFGFLARVSYDAKETVSIIQSSVLKNILLVGCVFVLTISAYMAGLLDRLSERKLFAVLTAVYCVAAVYLILNVEPVLRADAKQVLESVLKFREGDFAPFRKGGYLYLYPHQLGLVFYESQLVKFSGNPQFLFLVNFLMVLGINRISWKISDRLFGSTLINCLTILMSFLFLPQLFFILFAYGVIPGLFSMMWGFYWGICYTDERKPKDLVLMCLSLGAAVLLKQNYLIGAVAMLIFLCLELLKTRDRRLIAGVLAVLLCVTVPGKVLYRYYEQKTGSTLDQGCPSVLWVAMGTDIDNNKRGPGWYNSYNFHTYLDADSDPETAAEQGKQKLQENLEKIQTEPIRSLEFFFNKTVSQWCDPMYQSVWSGPLEDCGQETYTAWLQSLYSGESLERSISGCMKLLCQVIWVMAAMYLILNRKAEKNWEPVYLYMIGGLLFHTVWEGKSQYTYPYLYILIPFAAAAADGMLKRLTGKE